MYFCILTANQTGRRPIREFSGRQLYAIYIYIYRWFKKIKSLIFLNQLDNSYTYTYNVHTHTSTHINTNMQLTDHICAQSKRSWLVTFDLHHQWGKIIQKGWDDPHYQGSHLEWCSALLHFLFGRKSKGSGCINWVSIGTITCSGVLFRNCKVLQWTHIKSKKTKVSPCLLYSPALQTKWQLHPYCSAQLHLYHRGGMIVFKWPLCQGKMERAQS